MTGQQIELSSFAPQMDFLWVGFCVGGFFLSLWFVCLFGFWLGFVICWVFLHEQGAAQAVADLICVQHLTGKVATTSEEKKGQP